MDDPDVSYTKWPWNDSPLQLGCVRGRGASRNREKCWQKPRFGVLCDTPVPRICRWSRAGLEGHKGHPAQVTGAGLLGYGGKMNRTGTTQQRGEWLRLECMENHLGLGEALHTGRVTPFWPLCLAGVLSG